MEALGFRRPDLAQQLRLVLDRGRRLPVPSLKPNEFIKYIFYKDGRFSELCVYQEGLALHTEDAIVARRPYINLFAATDVTGGKMLARNARQILFGGKRVTGTMAEGLFG
ncbi:hypothetical protein CRT60_00855 [Azospirillum palustre]|uniref:Uncharacterized protein n=1 Tax=Azospirillum palustre TaxID=2044885 RepID=A0A2B8BCZ0_9PROT|nr:hypothetical protein [Azospirillum palustre]PGH59214.1 hypothetical protein CRT60_00855 [Azospirillum palustre]